MKRIEPADFAALVDLAMEDTNRRAMRPVIEKELLHFDILFALDRERLLDGLTFQGGTSLRLCYGAPRFSEDLDFAGGPDFSGKEASEIKTCLEDYIGRRYQLAVSVKPPKALRDDPRYAEVRVDKWQVSVTTAPARPDIATQKIKLEIASVPAYTCQAQGLQLHYPFLPDGYNDLLILAESLDEIMADKLISLVNTQRYVRNRDIWDIQWLKQQGARLDIGLVQRKLSDYRVEAYIDRARTLVERLPGLVHGAEFQQEMERFLPADTLERTLHDSRFADYLAREIGITFTEVINAMGGQNGPAPEFRL
ncbi:MAG: nucleotidyl transferase AbiEii/AbiGii toxin family protein [Salinicola sp.]|uniref:nucleotidyl transferase AbiEii/AbiGii toxin family protein n=1 Tax=Salinicola sp. TaxID=1978524 RepID=UPI001D8EC5C3|nr:nucleotidyl transferase AbiEii/AbiGii toxin family protein [Salinicola sp.]NRB56927.1 nucleotidyl transferase AbiEii/AbiGii toxin family protein [Salinicola sp.]